MRLSGRIKNKHNWIPSAIASNNEIGFARIKYVGIIVNLLGKKSIQTSDGFKSIPTHTESRFPINIYFVDQ